MKRMVPLILLFFIAVSICQAQRPLPEEVKALTQKVADWQIATFEESGNYRALPSAKRKQVEASGKYPAKWPDLTWHNGALYAGMYEWSTIADQPEKYTEFLEAIGDRNGWKLGSRPYHADDHTVGQFYLKLHEDTDNKNMLEPTQKHFDWVLANPKTGSLEWSGYGKDRDKTDCHKRWGWCDALFMAPPVWARLAKITGEQKYLDFMDQEYRATYDLLWDKEDHLFWRDSSYFKRREQNGRKLYWARGNGWVFGGLALMIPDLPEEWEGLPFYIDLYKQMAESLKNCQREDGTWSMGLLGGVEGYPKKETSGTSFFTFGLAWGINNGLLDRAEFEPVVLKAWDALTECVTEEGMLTWVQPVGAAPGESFGDKTEVYGIGAFLAAGSEVFKMVGDKFVAPDGSASRPYLTLMKDTGWCWYEDPRAIINNGKLVIGGVSGKSGDIRVGVYDLEKDEYLGATVLHPDFEIDDHDSPVFHVRPDGSLLAAWAQHGHERLHYYAVSDPDDYLKWGERKTFDHGFHLPEGSYWGGVTYMNLYTIESQGLLYNFFRDGPTYNPTYITSSDDGDTWGNRTHLIMDEVDGRHRPYARYQQAGPNRVGITFTDAHPRRFGNNLYYTEFDGTSFYRADGSIIKDLPDGPLKTSEAEKVYAGSATEEKPEGAESVPNSAWSCSSAVDGDLNPHLGYSLYLSNDDHRYRLASWNGSEWIDREIAYAGTCLYPKESSYTGLMALDPDDPERIAISTDVDPTTGKDLGGTYEIYMGRVTESDTIETIQWKPLTSGSEHKNIRPIIVSGDGYKVLMWLGGAPWRHFQDYETDALGLILERP